ncbi:MAG: GH1 family beta-glucosidase [Candidatus Limnocylindrales bacterium]
MSERREDQPPVEAFPADFLWGTATSAYQIDGGVREGGRTDSIWDTFAHSEGKTVRGETGDIACDHYHRWPEDVALMRDLGLDAYRFSVSWPRLQPGGSGPLNERGLDFYRALLEGLHEAGIRPLVTLYHWELPRELEDVGGWPERDTAARFADFAGATVEALGGLARDWITLNEPWCQAFLGYHSGIHAPGRQDLRAAVAAAHHQNLAHGLAVRAIRAASGEARVGVANILTHIRPASERPEDIAAAQRVDLNNNRLFLEPMMRGRYPNEAHELYGARGLTELVQADDEAVIAAPLDFLAVNHYHHMIIEAAPEDPHLGARGTAAEPATTSLGWSVTPEALYAVVRRVHDEYTSIPLYITENGASYIDYVDPDGEVRDVERVEYLRGYLGAVAQAIADGVDLRGYFAWSLMDNFEWGEGYRSRFGLVYVDYGTQQRIPKASARWYRDLISRHRAHHDRSA